ncbi:MAG: hypothetical protein COA71_04480 [SAR86 cluster bacterium]|uniref:Type II secretion system protein M n=1 Tax=SAR86 cluster bacterium TaxID=2030880 RepID=A0A2A5CG80_9GAMM|nr:MAG: hypothetical protein COA71_04480 [SAR86 cluster bacterium]
MSGKLFQAWSNLQDREKMTIVAGSILVLVTAGYLLFDALWTTRSLLIQNRVTLLEEREWMQEQAILAEQLINDCRGNQILALENSDLLELIASRNQLVLESFTENLTNNEAVYSMRIESNDGNSVLRFIHQSACQGFTLAHVQIEKSESESLYSGQVEFIHEG